MSDRPVTNYSRLTPVQMNGSNGYGAWQSAVLTFRGGAFRQNAACGTVNVLEEKLETVWSVPMMAGDSALAGQPAIVKWAKEIREMMNLNEEKKATIALKEVIFAAPDGHIYFLDLYDGKPTRDAMDIGTSMRCSISVHPKGMPMVGVGQAEPDRAGNVGYCLFNLIGQKMISFVNGLDKNAGSPEGAFLGSALVDMNSDCMMVAGNNGMLYTVNLGTRFDISEATLSVYLEVVSVKGTAGDGGLAAGYESSMAMYDAYAFLADTLGTVRCVDVDTMSPVWTLDVQGKTVAAVALDFDRDGTLALYTGNTVENGKGVSTVRRLDAMTGQQDWAYTEEAEPVFGGMGGCIASPLIGQGSIANLVVFTLAGTEEGGQIIALDKRTGAVEWQQPMAAYGVSSPVAVYNESGEAFILQGDSAGCLTIRDGLTGLVLDTLQLKGAVTGSPAVYNYMLVVATAEALYGIRIK